MSSVRRPHGRLFQIRGPAAPKLLSPKLLCVRGTAHMLSEEDRREITRAKGDSRHRCELGVPTTKFPVPVGDRSACLIQCYTRDHVSVPAKWHLIPCHAISRVHECDRHTHTDGPCAAAVISVAMGDITTFSDATQ